MAFIPEDEEGSEEIGMNVLGGGDQQQMQQQPQGQPQVSGGVPSTIGQQPTVGSQAPQALSRKKKGSGMFTDIRKYVQANQPAGQRMAGALQKTAQQRAGGIAQQMEQQKQQLAQRYQQEQQRLQQTQQAGQQAFQQAGQLVDPAQLQRQQATTQARIAALGDLQAGGYVGDIAGYEQQIAGFQPQIQQAQAAIDEYQPEFDLRQQAVTNLQNQLSLAQQTIGTPQETPADRQRVQELTTQLGAAQQNQQLAKAEFDARQKALEGFTGQQKSVQQQLQEAQGLQEKYARQQELQGQLTDIGQQLEAAPTEIDPAKLAAVRQFLGGEQTFGVGPLQTQQAIAEARQLAEEGRGLGRADVRRKLLQRTFGDADYTRGISGLDEMLLARSGRLGDIGQAAQTASEQALSDIAAARAERATRGQELAQEAQVGREVLTTGAEQQIADIEQRLLSGEAGQIGDILRSLEAPEGMSEAQLQALGGAGETYGLDVADIVRQQLQQEGIDAAGLATGTEAARLGALRQMLGQEPALQSDAGIQQIMRGTREALQERRQEYQAAEKNIENIITSGNVKNRGKMIAPELVGFARQGRVPTDAELVDMASRNFYSGGDFIPINVMREMATQAQDEFNKLQDQFSVGQSTLKSIGAKDGGIKMNALRRILNAK